MADFGKLNFSTSFNPTSAFPLDARCYFKSLALAEAAAATAEEVGSSNTVYYYGMKLFVDDGSSVKWYTIQRDRTLLEDSTASGIAEAVVQQIVLQRLSEFVVIGPDEPESGPCLWFDTSDTTTNPEEEPVVYFVLDRDTEASDVSVEIDETKYSVLNADAPVLADDGSTAVVNVSE